MPLLVRTWMSTVRVVGMYACMCTCTHQLMERHVRTWISTVRIAAPGNGSSSESYNVSLTVRPVVPVSKTATQGRWRCTLAPVHMHMYTLACEYACMRLCTYVRSFCTCRPLERHVGTIHDQPIDGAGVRGDWRAERSQVDKWDRIARDQLG